MPESFDYVVVGAGSAGAVVANRLTEDAGTSVLLLEAGPAAEADEITIPAAFANLFKTKWDWNYQTVGQKQLNSRSAYWPRMKALGGCSSMNAMIYIRGNRLDYDTWRDAYGAAGWGYDDVLPYFIKAEGNTRLGAPYHGQDGPLHVEDRRYTHPLTEAWVESAVAAGFKPTDDFNGADQEGAGLYQVTCKKGRRWSVAKAYLEPALDRPNLTVRTGAFVERVVVDGGRAVGVAYRAGDEDTTVHADAEVILSGGAVNSPQLLMLSGIGPATHLREVGVEVVHDLAGVGQNLHDHVAAPLIFHTKDTSDLAEFNNLVNFARAKATRHRPAGLQHRRGRRVLAQPRRPGRARPAGTRRGERVLGQRPARTDDPQGDPRADAGQRVQPWADPAPVHQPPLASRDRPGVLRRPGRPRRNDRGRTTSARDRSARTARPLRRRALHAHPEGPDRCRDRRAPADPHADALPPGRHLRHGRRRAGRRRPRAAGPRRGRAPRRRRQRDADGAPRQHQRTHDHDR